MGTWHYEMIMNLSDESDCHAGCISGARLLQSCIQPHHPLSISAIRQNLHWHYREIRNLTQEPSTHKWIKPRVILIVILHFQHCWAVYSRCYGCCEHLWVPSSKRRQKLNSPLERPRPAALSVTGLRKCKSASCLLLNITIILMDCHYRCTSAFLMIS